MFGDTCNLTSPLHDCCESPQLVFSASQLCGYSCWQLIRTWGVDTSDTPMQRIWNCAVWKQPVLLWCRQSTRIILRKLLQQETIMSISELVCCSYGDTYSTGRRGTWRIEAKILRWDMKSRWVLPETLVDGQISTFNPSTRRQIQQMQGGKIETAPNRLHLAAPYRVSGDM